MSWRIWLKGLLAAVISSAANSISVLIADPKHFNPTAAGGFRNLGVVALVSAIVGGALYLKQSPVPIDEVPKAVPKGEPSKGEAKCEQ